MAIAIGAVAWPLRTQTSPNDGHVADSVRRGRPNGARLVGRAPPERAAVTLDPAQPGKRHVVRVDEEVLVGRPAQEPEPPHREPVDHLGKYPPAGAIPAA